MSQMVSIRLSKEDAARMRRLRQQGIRLSDVTRDAIRQADQNLPRRARAGQSTSAVIAKIFEAYPDQVDDTLSSTIGSGRKQSAAITAKVKADHKRVVDDYLRRHKRADRPRRPK